jgi:hypothetical protein
METLVRDPDDGGLPLATQLDAIVAGFEHARVRLHRLVDERAREGWAARPGEGRWSAAECIAHLNLTGSAYVPLLRAALEDARALGAPAPRRHRRDGVGWLLSLATGPLPRIGSLRFGRVRTAPPFEPAGALALDDVVDEFDRLQAEQIALTRSAVGLPLGRVRIRSPFDARLGYNAYSCLVMLPRHQHRHLEQAEGAWAKDAPAA